MKADLNNAEITELDDLLQRAPQPLQPLDVVSLDGYLCAVAVQPCIVAPQAWLERALDTDGQRWPPADLDAAWLSRVRALMLRRYEALVRGMSQDNFFDPVVSDASAQAADDAQAGGEDELAGLPAHSRPLVHWASGFLYGAQAFEGLMGLEDDAVHLAISRILRHLPPETEEDRQLVAELDGQIPLRDETHAIEDVVEAAVALWDLTARERLAVRPVQREGLKVGRNDPCPCGSGKKHKQCHGKS